MYRGHAAFQNLEQRRLAEAGTRWATPAIHDAPKGTEALLLALQHPQRRLRSLRTGALADLRTAP